MPRDTCSYDTVDDLAWLVLQRRTSLLVLLYIINVLILLLLYMRDRLLVCQFFVLVIAIIRIILVCTSFGLKHEHLVVC